MTNCVFLDRDGVINVERGTYTWRLEDFMILPGVVKALEQLKNNGYLIIIVTNQSGITQGIYSRADMDACHTYLMQLTGNLIDDIYYATYHPSYSNSLLRKPDSLMFEKAIAKYEINTNRSWMIGDSERDLLPASKLRIRTIFIPRNSTPHKNQLTATGITEAANIILENQ
jgi:D-glycero-D-manno-heptose 1,7-bisphosphate phosphatase